MDLDWTDKYIKPYRLPTVGNNGMNAYSMMHNLYGIIIIIGNVDINLNNISHVL